jgi:parvulin-like peptidyl-prolyl isomerase
MKNIIVALLLLVSIQALAQPTVYEQFQKITTIAQAEQYIAAHPELKPVLLNLSLDKDSTPIDKRLFRQNQGDVFSVGYITYKVLQVKDTVNYRASYIFLDGATYSKSQIDSLKTLIAQKINSGESFEKLSDQYTMDGNDTHGDTGWFFGEYMVPKQFQDAVAGHKTGEVFFFDDSEKQWHYIIKKTHDDQVKKEIVVLRANGR